MIAELSVTGGIRGFVGDAVLATQFAGNEIEDSFEVGRSANEENGSTRISR